MKATLKLATRQYSYIEILDTEGTAEEVVAQYFEMEKEYRKQADAHNQGLRDEGKSKEQIFDEGLDKLK